MSISAIAATAQNGVQQAFNRFDQSARKTVADVNGGHGDLSNDVVDQITAKQTAQANLKVLKVADEMIGSLLDIKV